MKRKKWLQKTAVLCTAMVLSATSIPSATFAADSYADIEKSALAKIASEFALWSKARILSPGSKAILL